MMIRSKKFKGKKLFLRLVCVCICALTLLGSLPIKAAGGLDTSFYDKEYYKVQLKEKGFPDDYADILAELKTVHPSWSFEPLFVSGLEPSYTFDYIIKKETEDPSTNLIYPSKEYSAYRDKTDSTEYDSGWYSASDEAVRYFMDPRNFLSEQDIFQFEDLRYRGLDYSAGVDGVISGTFMESLVLESGVSLRDHLLYIGDELGVSPVHIAARLRQEQGTENTSGMISGDCGSLLYYFYKNGIYKTDDGILINTPSSGYTKNGLLSYNGYYNFFNSGASGTGMFYIYLNAMKRAQLGTPELAYLWGGDASWNSMEKSLFGGAYAIKKTYIDDYQNTLYLQKFNVDPRSSRNFWGQYMQNIGAALSEGRRAYISYKEAGILESEFSFLIPVYSGMPKSKCPDPAGGASPLSASDELYSYITHTDYPNMKTKQNAECRDSVSISTATLRLQGWSVHTNGTERYELSIDGGEFFPVLSYARADVREKYSEDYPLSYDVNAYLHYVDLSAFSAGKHTFVIRAKRKDGAYCQISFTEILLERHTGDIDGDGSITERDVILLLRYLSGHDETLYSSPDIDGNGKVNNRDVAALIKLL